MVKKYISSKNQQRTIALQDFDVTTKEKITLEVPKKKQKIVLTITKRHYYDPMKKKVITDQVVHRARYSLNKKTKNEKKGDLHE